jgi:hypothetical protein
MSVTDRWLEEVAKIAEVGVSSVQMGERAQAANSQVCQPHSDGCTEEEGEMESPTVGARACAELPAIPATSATGPGEILDIQTASRGPCYRCGEPVTWHDGMRNWFGKLVHHRCARRWKEQAPAGERQRVGTGPRCKFAVFADNAIQTGGGAVLHPGCARD